MVVKKNTVTSSWRIPPVRIESRELLAIVREMSDSGSLDVSAETDQHKFESLEDIERNIELLRGSVEIFLGPVRINLTNGLSRGVSIRWGVAESDLANAEALAERFVARISEYRIRLTRGSTLNILSLGLSFLLTYYLFLPVVVSWLPTASELLLFGGLLFIYWIGGISFLGLIFKDKDVVYFSEREGFVSRNADKILTGFLMLIAGAAVTKLVEHLFS